MQKAHQPSPVDDRVLELTREEQGNRELAAFLKEIQTETEAARKYDRNLRGHDVAYERSLGDISPDSVYPSDISCRSTFDYAMFCQSFGGQFVNVYRYGSFRSCSNHWQDFWLCVRTRNWRKEDREKAVKDHYRQKAIKYKTGPSSENVWEVRTEPFREAFQGNLEALEERVAQWERANTTTTAPSGPTSGDG